MMIAIDYDDTFTCDPHLWRLFIGNALDLGHQVVCVTMRRHPPHDDEPKLPNIPIVCTAGLQKRAAAQVAGFMVDVWIDDMPEAIGEIL